MLIRFGQNYFLSDTQQPRECCAIGPFECEIDSDTTRNSLDTCLCPKMKLGLCLRARIPSAFNPGPPQSLAASSGSSGLAGHAGCPGAGCVTNSGLVGPWGGAALGSLDSELLLGCTRSPILLSGVSTVRPLCKPLLLICRDLCTRSPSFRRDHAREGLWIYPCPDKGMINQQGSSGGPSTR